MRLLRQFLLVAILAFAVSPWLHAQGLQVKGVVKDNKGEPLIGVQVIPVGATEKGTVTDLDGNYAVSVPKGITKLQYSYIGFATQTIDIAGRSKIDVTMSEDSKVLDAVVVTAMGIERKSKSLTYATQTVSNKDLTRVQDANFVNALQGKTSGLTITPNSGGAGSASKILLRGNASIQGKNAPLIVVDGIPMSNGVAQQTNGYNVGYAAVNEGSDPLSTINPDDIASVNILKGANAAALYGSDAANGVIIITTKKGREGVLKVDFTSNAQMERPMLLPELQNKYGSPISDDGKLNASSWGAVIADQTAEQNALPGISGRPHELSDFFDTGVTMNNSVSLSGGTEKVQTYFSLSNTTARGIMPGNKFQRNGATLRTTFNFLDGKLKIDVSGNYVYQTTDNAVSGGVYNNPLYNLYLAPRNIDMDYYKANFEREGTWESEYVKVYPKYEDKHSSLPGYNLKPRDVKNMLSGMQQHWFQGRGVNGANNPYWLINRMPSESITQRLFATMSATYRISPLFDVVYRINLDRNWGDSNTKTYATTVDPTGKYIDRGAYSWTKRTSLNFYTDALVNYHQTLAKDWSVAASLGGSFKRYTGEDFWMRNIGAFDRRIYHDVTELPTRINLFTPNAAVNGPRDRSYALPSDWARSVFATAQLGWQEKAYLDASYRIDWSRAFSQFGAGVDPFYGYFSLGANALLHELVKLPDFVNMLKLRASVSEVGNSIPNFNFGALETSTSGSTKAAQYTDFKNPKPETVRSYEAGFDLAALNNRLNLDLTYYNSTMFNQFLPIAGSSGTNLPINSGQIRNQGIETTLSYSFDLMKDLRWRTSVNYAFNTNTIISTYKNRKDIYVSIGAGDQLRVLFQEGGSYGDIYAKDFARYNEVDALYERKNFVGKPVVEGEIRLNPDGSPSLDSEKGHSLYLGNMNAKHTFGWSNTFSYKGIDLYFLIDGKLGGKVISFTEAYLDREGVSRRTGEARDGDLRIEVGGQEVPAVRMPDGNLAPVEAYYSTLGAQLFASQYVYDATNLRLREVSLGYTFRDLLGRGKDMSLSLIGRNLFFLYRKAPVDPDVSLSTANALGGIDVFNLPTSRSVGLNVKLSF
ncbi:MAG: SusC/RagA family TonB-linked outer membrane protein [Porphyromonadaceae bacterium]|nr:SusC/RagA family TonB-linked outer membrane protein [Porphyromonadaceae bacterium]